MRTQTLRILVLIASVLTGCAKDTDEDRKNPGKGLPSQTRSMECSARGSDTTEPSENDERAVEAIRGFCEYAKTLQSVRVHIIHDSERDPPIPAKYNMRTEYDFSLRRPGMCRLDHTAGITGFSIACDGAAIYSYDVASKRYSLVPLVNSLAEVAQPDAVGTMKAVLLRGFVAVYPLVHDDPFAALSEDYRIERYIGTATDECGVECQVVELANREADCEVWIEAGAAPLIRKVIYRQRRSTFASNEENGRRQSLVVLTNRFVQWDINPQLSTDMFRIKPPTDGKLEPPRVASKPAEAGK